MTRPTNRLLSLGMTVLLAGLPVVWAQPLPDEDDILAQSKAAHERLGKFMRASIEPRLAYEYKDYFCDEKEEAKLAQLASRASLDLQKICSAQERMRRRIEDYQGDDWDNLYGATGEWRKVCADAQRTSLMKAQVDYYIGLATKSEERQQILQDIISVCKLSEPVFGRAAVGLLKARALTLMADSNQAFEEQARSELESILSGDDLPDETYFEAVLTRLKLEPNPDMRQIEALAERVRRSECADDFELNLKVAFFALRFGKVGFLKAVIAKWPEAEDFAGRMILSEMVERLDGGKIGNSVFEVELAAKATRQKWIEKYRELLVKLCEVKRFQTPLVLYVTAQACAESAPAAALEYYLRATLARQELKNGEFELDAVQIAEQGAQLAHRVYYEEQAQGRSAVQMIDYYCKIAGERVDETIEYLYTRLLSSEGRTGEAIELLRKISEKRGRFSKQARLDLIVHSLKNGSEDLQLRNELTKKLKNLIGSVDNTIEEDGRVKAEATHLYCELILEKDDKSRAQEVLALLEETEGLDIARSRILKAVALKKLGRFWAAVNELLTAAKFDDCEYADEGLDILRTILDNRIDEHKYFMADFAFYIDACDRLAEYCLACAQPQRQAQAGLIRAEIALLCPRKSLAGDDNNESLDKAEEILNKLSVAGNDNDIDWLRCKARLLMAKGEFSAAFRVWRRIRAANKTESENQSREWWRAKFYEIRCWSKLAETAEADVGHAVEVLQHTCGDIPRFWAMKLQALKNGTDR